VWREVVESIARRGVSVSLGVRGPNRFPSVPDRPLQHLSALESTSCGRSRIDYRTRRYRALRLRRSRLDSAGSTLTKRAKRRNCVRPLNEPRSLTAIFFPRERDVPAISLLLVEWNRRRAPRGGDPRQSSLRLLAVPQREQVVASGPHARSASGPLTGPAQIESSWSRDHEDGGPTIQLPAAEVRCTLRFRLRSVYALITFAGEQG
jgi:hypothetical protein